ncbi:conserved hypothetical protein [Pseudarthrobacter chlorophenolicus A6]|uniref:Lipoprotein n=1 Tax=Pseudarthrobacter chlorophenolicus (strain ATCC 700700 / DSM 12829 / CIP 107037 / JCM 12360 / KCTC 9906 / NCIMB 13794 / A6) TaxID=452863 RepID=B8HGG9_PSECP|nr:hypothetical protein [Pseudarthrobacter chlorophenolicus]ACL41235.1 conserved hypothetical protein [Pseudarthrobacter chlorophenolicus A6]SDQ67860.1 hypothetical protein SAMN04489738_2206 [Pseudarthrobacter chlorophenolicus]
MKKFRGLLPVLVLTAVAVGGCGGQQASPPMATATVTGTVPASTVPPGPATTTAAPAPAKTALKTFTTADGQLAFDHPAGWSVRDPAGELPEGGGAFAEVTNEAGKPLATLRTNMATGSICTEKYPFEEFESQQLPALAQAGTVPRFVYESRGNSSAPGPANTPAAAYGITVSAAPAGDLACPIFQFFTWPPTAAMFGAFYSPENNTTPGAENLPYLEQARKYMDTTEYQDIRRMITSLRPAG